MSETLVSQTLLQEGRDLMLMGMGTVFVFLAILVAVTSLMSRLVNRFCPEEAAVSPEPVISPSASNGPVDGRVVQIIQAALNKHRGK